jgi:NTE family protein
VKSVALALGAGGARGLSHIAVFEALDELGIKPVAIAGSSIGAIAGAVYGAGMSGKAIRRYVVDIAHNRAEVWRRLMLARAGTIRGMFNGNFSAAVRLDAEKLIAQFLPDVVPDDFGALGIPLTVVASNLYGRREVTFNSGPLKPALAASIALPTIMRPVMQSASLRSVARARRHHRRGRYLGPPGRGPQGPAQRHRIALRHGAGHDERHHQREAQARGA